MSFENLKNNYSKLLEFLEKEKYSATVIRCVSREIKNILENAQANQWETYKNIYHAYEHHGLSKDVLRSRRHILRMIERYDVRGEFPDRLRRSYAFESDAYECLPDEFKNLIKFYRSYGVIRQIFFFCKAFFYAVVTADVNYFVKTFFQKRE